MDHVDMLQMKKSWSRSSERARSRDCRLSIMPVCDDCNRKSTSGREHVTMAASRHSGVCALLLDSGVSALLLDSGVSALLLDSTWCPVYGQYW